LWATKRGGRRGRIADRVRTGRDHAARSKRSGRRRKTGRAAGNTRFVQRLASIGDRLPLFDAKYRLKLKKEMARSGYRSSHAVSVLLAVKFVVGFDLRRAHCHAGIPHSDDRPNTRRYEAQ